MGILAVCPELSVASFGLGEFILQVIHCGSGGYLLFGTGTAKLISYLSGNCDRGYKPFSILKVTDSRFQARQFYLLKTVTQNQLIHI